VPRAKVEHFVPRCYLQNWAGRNSQVHVFDKPTGRTYRANVKNVAAEGAFYDLAGPDETQHVEERLSDLEGKLDQLLKAVTAELDGGLLLSRSHKEDLAFFMALQLIRTAEERRDIEQTSQGAMRALQSEQLGPNLLSFANSAQDPEHAKVMQNLLITDFDTIFAYAKVLLSHIWLVGVNYGDVPIWTSDHPVVRRPNVAHPHKSYSGIGSSGIELNFPLSPRYVLMLAERSFFRVLASRDGDRTSLDVANVIYCNSLQVAQAYRQVFSSTVQFDLAYQMRNESPHLFKLDRKRVSVIVGGREI
jgi:hypothetical protein